MSDDNFFPMDSNLDLGASDPSQAGETIQGANHLQQSITPNNIVRRIWRQITGS